jgi:hypothetical protein
LTTTISSTSECVTFVVVTWATFKCTTWYILLKTTGQKNDGCKVHTSYTCYRPKFSTHTLHSNKAITNLLTRLQLESKSFCPILVAQTPSSKHLCLWVYAIVREDLEVPHPQNQGGPNLENLV